MYEQAYRLGQHNSVDALEHQVKCYLACINCLYFVDQKLQWVLRPVDQGEEKEEFLIPHPAGSDPQKVMFQHGCASNIRSSLFVKILPKYIRFAGM